MVDGIASEGMVTVNLLALPNFTADCGEGIYIIIFC